MNSKASQVSQGGPAGPLRLLATLTASAAGMALLGCAGSSTPPVVGGGETIDTGSSFFFTEPHSSGAATDFHLVGLQYGRLVQLFGQDGSGLRVSMGSDFVISQSLQSNGIDFLLEFNAVTGQENLTILRNVETEAGRASFIDLAREAGEDLDIIQVQDLGAALFSMMPRNAAVVVKFDDLLRDTSIDRRTVQVATGVPPSLPFEGRVFASEYYGGIDGSGTFHPTRVVIDLTISELDAAASAVPIVVNTIGLPPSLTVVSANAQLRVPTRIYPAVGITQVLSNLSNHQLSTTNNGPVDFAAVTRPVTRAFRSGGRPDVINDPSNGFLRDELPPVVIGSTPILVAEAPVQFGGSGSRLFRLPRVTFASLLCASPAQKRDVVVQPGVVAEVIADGAPPAAGAISDVIVELILFPAAWSGPGDWELFGLGAASYGAAFDQLTDITRPECFVQISPQATGFPSEPSMGLLTGARMSLSFSEPMDPLSLTAFDSMTLTREELPTAGNLPTSDYLVGSIAQTADLRGVTFVPDQPLGHQSGASENYFLTLASIANSFPPRDLAGNVVETFPAIEMILDPNQAEQLNGGRVSRFTSIDEEPPFGNKPEWSGQFLIDPLRELIRPRPIVRTQVVIDESQAVVRLMTAFPQGVVTPLSNFGSKMQTIWRSADCGFSLTETQDMNIDIDGIWWKPAGGVITPDAFSEFEIRLSHCRFAPDEVINPATLFPTFQNSGLRPNYETNVLQGAPQVTVHPRQDGYTVDPGELWVTPTGTTLLPFPLNQAADLEDYTFYTWRDTKIRERGGQTTSGADPRAYLAALGLPPQIPPFYRANHIQTVGLPLLMEFRTYPDENAIGVNGWVLALAVNSSSRPYFRAFTTGGVNQSGTNVFIDPDTQSAANGGFNPGSVPTAGATTFGRDNTVHMGALDYVTRISLVHSIWFESPIEGEPNFTTRRYNPPTLEPATSAQPPGTAIDVDFRGAIDIVWNDSGFVPGDNDQDANGIVDYTEDAFTLDLYGDYYNDITGVLNHDLSAVNPGLLFLSLTPPDAWRDTVSEITDARYYQVRVNFRGNAATGQTPELSAFAMTWNQN